MYAKKCFMFSFFPLTYTFRVTLRRKKSAYSRFTLLLVVLEGRRRRRLNLKHR